MRSLPAALCSSLLLLACAHPRAAPPLPASSTPPPLFVELRGPAPAGFVDHGPSCPVEVGLAPSPFFGEYLLIRLPPPVEAEDLRGGTNLVRSTPLAMGCEDGLAATVFVSRSYPSPGQLAAVRTSLFGDLHFPATIEQVILDGSDSDGDVAMALAFPDDAVWGSSRVYLRMFERYGRVYGVGFITEASSYHRLEPTFAASAATMVALPE